MTDATPMRRGPHNGLTDVPGIRVGHAQRIGDGFLTGATVVLAPPGGVVTGVDVRGGGPGTRETDALDPGNLVPRIEAVVLTGGSAYGLDAAGGVVRWLEEHRRGFRVGPRDHQVVPVVPAAALFDLGRGGDFRARPDADFGYAAVVAAHAAPEDSAVPLGCVGAGTGALAGDLRGGIGSASAVLADGVVVAALVAVNSAGSCTDPGTGMVLGCRRGLAGEFPVRQPDPDEHTAARTRIDAAAASRVTMLNTTVGVVATNARLTRAEARRTATAAHAGLARAIVPVHTLYDGDVLFAMATGDVALPPDTDHDDFERRMRMLRDIHEAAADTVSRAVASAVLSATSTVTPAGTFPAYRDLYPNACRPLTDST